MKLQLIILPIYILFYCSQLNGQTFTMHNEGNSPSSLQTLAIDDDNRIWVAQTTAFSGNLDYFYNGAWTLLGWEDENLMSARATDMIVNDGIVELVSYGGLSKIDWQNEIFDTWDVNGDAVQCIDRNISDDILYLGTNILEINSNNEWENEWAIPRPITMDYHEESNSMWVGSSIFGGIYKIQDGDITNYDDNFRDVFDLEVDSEGIVWMVVEDKGLVRFDGESFTYFNTGNSNLLNNKPKVLTIDHFDNIWIGGYEYGGLSYFDKINFTNYEYSLDQIPTHNIRQMKIGHNNDLWMATASGLMQFSSDGPLKVNNSDLQVSVCYPNPFKHSVNIKNHNDFSKYEIFDIDGKMLQFGKIDEENLDLSNLKLGLYTLRLIDKNHDNHGIKILKH